MIKLLGVFSNFMLKQGMMGAHGCMGGCFCFKIQFFLSTKVGDHNFKT